MSLPVVQAADALVSLLNGHEFTVPFEAVRRYIPTHTLAELRDLRVIVRPEDAAIEPESRTSLMHDVSIQVGVQKKISGDADIDEVLGLVDEIINLLAFGSLPDIDATWLGFEHDPVVSFEDLDQNKVLLSILTVRYRVRAS